MRLSRTKSREMDATGGGKAMLTTTRLAGKFSLLAYHFHFITLMYSQSRHREHNSGINLSVFVVRLVDDFTRR